MRANLDKIPEHMKYFSFNLLGSALYNTLSEYGRPFANSLSVINAAQGAEILIKARIMEEHPLLIFKKYPPKREIDTDLDFNTLYEHGRSYSYSELPYILLVTTRYKIKNEDEFQEYGKLRNGLIHLASPDIDYSEKTLKFIFKVLDQMIWDFWNVPFLKDAAYWSDDVIVSEGYIGEMIEAYNISIHPKTEEFISKIKID